MILGSFEPKKIGERVVGIRDGDYVEHPDQPCVVVRTASFIEWCEFVGHDAAACEMVRHPDIQRHFFYEVATD